MKPPTGIKSLDMLWNSITQAPEFPEDLQDIDASWVESTLEDLAEEAPAIRDMLAQVTLGDLRGIAEDLRDVLHAGRADAAIAWRLDCPDY